MTTEYDFDMDTVSYWEDFDVEGEAPALPEEDGTYQLLGGWVRADKTDGYWVATTQGDFDWESDAEYGEYVGKWWDHTTGITHIDRSIWVAGRTEAEARGHEHNQLAIWDIAAGKEIRL